MEFVIGHSVWDDSDYVVTIRPSYEMAWRSIPLGGVLSERQACLIAEWLQGAMPTLWKIFQNVSKERTGTEGEHANEN